MLSTIQSLQPDVLHHKKSPRGKNKAQPISQAALCDSTDVSLAVSEDLCPTLQTYLRYLTPFGVWETEHRLANLLSATNTAKPSICFLVPFPRKE